MATAKICSRLAIVRKICIKSTISIVTRKGDITAATVVSRPYHKNLAIGLHHHTIATVITSEIRDHLAIAEESCIKATVSIVACKGKIITADVVGCIGSPRHNDLTISLHNNTAASTTATKIRSQFAIR